MKRSEWLELEGNKYCPQCGCMAGYYQDPETKINYCSGICAGVYKERNMARNKESGNTSRF